MIRTLNDGEILIGPASELFQFSVTDYVGRFKLPLFSTSPSLIEYNDIINNEDYICFVIDYVVYNIKYKGNLPLSLVETINKEWNKFYDT